MGRELFERNNVFHDWMVRLDKIARQLVGRPVLEEIYSSAHGRGDPFDRTLLTHPAIFMVEFALTQCLIHADIWPDMVMGASLGSFAAATVAGFIGVEDAVAAVIQQAMALERQCEPGGMIAILAGYELFKEEFLSGHSELAAVNFSSHFVVSAAQAELGAIESTLRSRNVSCQRLPVSFPFHSRWIDAAEAPFADFMRTVRRTQGRFPLVCCDETALLSVLPDDYFWNVVRRPIRFRETIARLEQRGAHRYIDVGPSGTLATLAKYALPAGTESTTHAVLTPYGLDVKNLKALTAAIRDRGQEITAKLRR